MGPSERLRPCARPTARRARGSARAFTLVELIVAGMVAVIVVGVIGTALHQLSSARATAKVRLAAHLRAYAALERIRREVQQVIRSDSLIDTRVVVEQSTVPAPIEGGEMPRATLRIYTTKIAPVRSLTLEGSGIEHELQLRVEDDDLGSALWMRDDPVPDDNDEGGGMAEPLMEGILGMYVEVSDGQDWYDEWDSDISGIPHALRVWIFSAGDPDGEDPYEDDRELMTLRTIIPFDRAPPPYEPPAPEETLGETGGLAAQTGAGEPGAATAGNATATDPTAGVPLSGTGAGGAGGRGTGSGMGRGGPGRGGPGRGGPNNGRGGGGRGMGSGPGGPGGSGGMNPNRGPG